VILVLFLIILFSFARFRYYIATNGLVWNDTFSKVLNGNVGVEGYIRMCLMDRDDVTGRPKAVQIMNHVLVTNRFLNPVGGDTVTHHINGVKWDNRRCNLQIVPQVLNAQYGRGHSIIARCLFGGREELRFPSITACCQEFNLGHRYFVRVYITGGRTVRDPAGNIWGFERLDAGHQQTAIRERPFYTERLDRPPRRR
jgi:hypothetical protein